MVPEFKCWSLCWCQKQLSKCSCCPGAPSLSCEPGPSGHYHTRNLQGSSAEYMLTCPVSLAVRDPLSRVASSPHHGSYPAKIVLSTAVPLVAVSMALRRPIRPRVGIKYFSLQHQQEVQMCGYLMCGPGTQPSLLSALSKHLAPAAARPLPCTCCNQSSLATLLLTCAV